MDDRLLMSMLHSLTDLGEKCQPFFDRQAMLIAVRRDGEAGHVLHDEKRAPFRRGPCVENFGDVGMLHERQGLTLRLESRHDSAGVHAHLNQLECDSAMKGRGLFGAPDLSHAADAEHLNEPVRTNAGKRGED